MTALRDNRILVHRYRVFSALTGGYAYSTRMATAERIAHIDGERIEGTGTVIDAGDLMPGEGWTPKNYTVGAN